MLPSRLLEVVRGVKDPCDTDNTEIETALIKESDITDYERKKLQGCQPRTKIWRR